ncbi:MAG: Glycosyltransferase [Nitrospira sp.]|jgi:glycosyltransferase involved in cell wall biosynthesis|nr:MAG: Glycosyltransferase [Nitrospira sp.]
MKIVFVNRFFYPDHSATSQMLTDLAFHLSKSGASICHVITSRQAYDKPGTVLASSENVGNVHVNRVWTTRFGRHNLLGRSLDYLTFYLSAGWHLLIKLNTGDVVIAKTDPPLISVVAAIAAKLRGATLVNWIQDLFPEVADVLGVGGRGTTVAILRRLRNWSLKIAPKNVAIGEGMASRLLEDGVPSERIRVIHNWADGQAIQPVDREKNDLRCEWNLGDKFVVGYSGNFGRAHEFGTILSAAEILKDLSHIVFLFIGAGAQLEWMHHNVENKRLRNVMFRPYQPRERLAMSLSVPDVHVISLLPSLEGLIVPSKFYGIAAAGRAILYIGDKEGEIPQLIRRAHCGISVEVHDAQEAAAAIDRLARDPTVCSRLGLQARILFDQRFEKSYAERAWQSVIAEAMQQT